MQHTIELTITVEQYGFWVDLPLVVEYRTWEASRGRRDKDTGYQLEPDEPAGMEVELAWLKVYGADQPLQFVEVHIDDKDALLERVNNEIWLREHE